MKRKQKPKINYFHVILATLEWFYRETGLTITVLGREGEIIAHYGGGVDVCRYIRSGLCQKCKDCDKEALKLLLNGYDLCQYLCHAGLSEAAILVRSDDGDFDGYIIIGKYLTEETLEASKALMQSLSDKDVDVSAVRRAAETLVPLNAEQLDHALCCLSAVARRFEETGCLKGFRDPDVRHAVQMVDRNYEKATCTALYGDIHLTQHPTGSNFERQCGVRPSAFLTQRKMIRAEDMLMNTNDSVEKISELLGYDLCAFTTFFKHQYGDTPGHFRRYGAKDGIANDKKIRKDTVPFRDRAPNDDEHCQKKKH